jgi:hypothetical protein
MLGRKILARNYEEPVDADEDRIREANYKTALEQRFL